MPRRPAAPIVPRKHPRQERSARLVTAILQAAIRVLERDGAAAFTTIRVAERAGVSVGSLYQYFPNKESILFRLQQEEWIATGRLLDGIFGDRGRSAADRLRAAMIAFFRTEFDERLLRRALGDAAPLYRDAPEAREQRRRGLPLLRALTAEVAPTFRRAAVPSWSSSMSRCCPPSEKRSRKWPAREPRPTGGLAPPRTCFSPTFAADP